MKTRILGILALTAVACGGDGDRSTAEGTCDDVAAADACLTAALAEVAACAGDQVPLVEGALSTDRSTCTDATDASRTVTFEPAVTTEGEFGTFTIEAGGSTCATYNTLDGAEWGFELVTSSGTFAIWREGTVLTTTCPDGTTADTAISTFTSCPDSPSVAEATGMGSNVSYNGLGQSWYRCAVP